MAKKTSEPSGWVGWILFAGFMMIMLGSFNAVAGLVAIFNPDFLVATSDRLLVFDLTAWGWWHLIIGVLVLIAGFQVMQGVVWARLLGVVVAVFNAVGAMATVETYPVWSIMLLVVDILVIYALTVHGDEMVVD